jgi:AbrB family looped-hinge helix DNA binding protein
LSKVRVKRKGQVTIPIEMRVKHGIEEGAILEITDKDDSIILKPLPQLEPGQVVGEEEYKRIIAELEARRRNWR